MTKTKLPNHPRITIDPTVMGGVPCIRGLRIPVTVVVDELAETLAADVVLALYPDLERADIPAALRFAAESLRGEVER